MELEKINLNNLKFSIDQVSEITKIPKPKIRYLEKIYQDFLKPARTLKRKGYSHRRYSLKDIEIIMTIKRLTEEEYLTSEGIRIRLRAMMGVPPGAP